LIARTSDELAEPSYVDVRPRLLQAGELMEAGKIADDVMGPTDDGDEDGGVASDPRP
jgi:hypothetical protein